MMQLRGIYEADSESPGKSCEDSGGDITVNNKYI